MGVPLILVVLSSMYLLRKKVFTYNELTVFGFPDEMINIVSDGRIQVWNKGNRQAKGGFEEAARQIVKKVYGTV